jgi:hypothetical protein
MQPDRKLTAYAMQAAASVNRQLRFPAIGGRKSATHLVVIAKIVAVSS